MIDTDNTDYNFDWWSDWFMWESWVIEVDWRIRLEDGLKKRTIH